MSGAFLPADKEIDGTPCAIGMKVLVTGGAGFIGSHTCVSLIENGYDVVIADDLSNSSEEVINRISAITGVMPEFYKGNVCNDAFLDTIFTDHRIEAVIHFAGFKAVAESVEKPLMYYQNNLFSTITLLNVMRRHGVNRIIFSSSATVYGQQETMPIPESAPKGVCSNPYGWTKWMIEQILTDTSAAREDLRVTLLRYFNPIGAHPSGFIGEDPKGIPNNLMPYITQVAIGKREVLRVFGNDYRTHDGTGVRDYIHVCDLAEGHVKALAHMDEQKSCEIYNLGTGVGYSVLDVVRAFEKACGKKLPYVIAPRRPGDIDICYCDPSKARKELGFAARYDLQDMCRDSWNWQQKNPEGYE